MGRIVNFEGVRIVAAASVVGKEEHLGPLGGAFDEYDESDRFGADTWEKAEAGAQGRALALALKKAGANAPELLFAGDLQNQCMASAEGLISYGIPFFGLYGACSTATEALLLASLALSAGAVKCCAAVTSSHFAAAERQFRFPLEYGGQRAPTAQWTATAAGAFVLTKERAGVRISRGMAGRMVDSGIADAANMGAAMAPAAADSILTFLRETGTTPSDYDAIVTGDLGKEGSRLLAVLCEREGVRLSAKHEDCGCLLYDGSKQDAHAGASGCGCSASVLAAHYLPRLTEGLLRRVLFLSTGALMSPQSVQQKGNIIGIAPALLLEF
ncbi:MAG: stage V sporulation protein AD [Clostridia bacterium]|nr:stage V sporulation protein AD [Clostridia bacterium]